MIGPLVFIAALAPAAAAVEPASSYDCQAAGGDYETMELSGSDRRVEISGTLAIIDLARDRDWLPAAGVLFRPENAKGGIGLQVWRRSNQSFVYGFRRLDSDVPTILGTVQRNEPLEFTIALDNSGHLNLRVNDKAYFLDDIRIKPTRPILMCSGGHFRFERLTTASAPR